MIALNATNYCQGCIPAICSLPITASGYKSSHVKNRRLYAVIGCSKSWPVQDTDAPAVSASTFPKHVLSAHLANGAFAEDITFRLLGEDLVSHQHDLILWVAPLETHAFEFVRFVLITVSSMQLCRAYRPKSLQTYRRKDGCCHYNSFPAVTPAARLPMCA